MLQEMAEEAGRPCMLVGRIGGVAGDEREVAGLDIPFQQRRVTLLWCEGHHRFPRLPGDSQGGGGPQAR